MTAVNWSAVMGSDGAELRQQAGLSNRTDPVNSWSRPMGRWDHRPMTASQPN